MRTWHRTNSWPLFSRNLGHAPLCFPASYRLFFRFATAPPKPAHGYSLSIPRKSKNWTQVMLTRSRPTGYDGNMSSAGHSLAGCDVDLFGPNLFVFPEFAASSLLHPPAFGR